MSYENITLESSQSLATITLNRPEKLNAFVASMREEILAALCECEAGEIRAVIITGAGNGFCAGADVRFLAEVRKNNDRESLDRVLTAARRVVQKIRALPKPVIAAVNGPVAGGGINLALACDVRIASQRATFGETFIRLGLHPDWGGTYFLPRLAGPSTACEMMMSGDVIDAHEALRLGLVNRVAPHDDLIEESRRMAQRFTRNSPRILAMIKQAIYAGAVSDFETMLFHETSNQKKAFELEESAEGLRAFLEKREPRF